MRPHVIALAALVFASAQAAATARAEDPYAYLRLDADRDGVSAWAGGNHPLGGGAYVAADVIGHLADTTGQVDLGLVLPLGGALSFLPTAGAAFDFGGQRAHYLVPRLITVLEVGPLYLESWVRLRLRTPFVQDTENDFHTRNFLLFTVSRVIAVGPQHELTYVFENAAGDATQENALGGRVNLGFGEGNVLGLFLGYDFADAAAGHLAGRFTFVRSF